jgi:superfamily II DNA helicase RecQ
LNRSLSQDTVYFDALDSWNSDPESSLIQSPKIESQTSENLIHNTLKYTFNQETFIPNQMEAISAAMEGKDVFLVLPSGPLRNICYQAPIIAAFEQQQVIGSITIVIVSSLASLIYHKSLCSSDKLSIQKVIKSYPLEETWTDDAWVLRDQLYAQLIVANSSSKNSLPLLLYFTYDDFSKSKLTIQTLYQQNRIARFVIDEAHCLSQWGTDFHFGYLRATENLRPDYPNIPITVMTGIPNQRIQLDIMNSLHIQNTSHIFKKSIFLP